MTHSATPDIFADWLDALETRHLADLRVSDVTRALRALSSAYVERRHTGARGAALDGAGKRAAFALFYGPLHFLATTAVVRATGLDRPGLRRIVDLGCGTGVGGAAWAVSLETRPSVSGIDRHPWAAAEARWTYQVFGLEGRARQGDAARLPPLAPHTGVIAAYFLNELADDARRRLIDDLAAAGRGGARVLILEPIARAIAPWWDDAAARVIDAGGRADEWRFTIERPRLIAQFDRATGLHHSELKLRSLAIP
jgi:hypothetical protein